MLVNSSASIALSLLSGNATRDMSAGASLPLLPTSGARTDSPRVDRSGLNADFGSDEFIAAIKQTQLELEGLRNGTISPFDKTLILKPAVNANASADVRQAQREGGLFIGSQAPSEGGDGKVADAAFPDRRSSVANAYTFAMSFVVNNREVSRLSNAISSLPDRQAELRSSNPELASAKTGPFSDAAFEATRASLTAMQDKAELHAERAKASLSRMFSFTDSGLRQNENGTLETKGFSISHGTLGKIMDVDASGRITVYDQKGNSYSQSEYVASSPDGAIPGMAADLANGAFAPDGRLLTIGENNKATLAQYMNDNNIGSMTRITGVELTDFIKLDARF